MQCQVTCQKCVYKRVYWQAIYHGAASRSLLYVIHADQAHVDVLKEMSMP